MNKNYRLLFIIIVATFLNCSNEKGEIINYTSSNGSILKKRAFELSEIEIDSVTLNEDSLVVFVTNNHDSLFNDVLVDQYIKILFQDYSFASETEFSQVKLNYQMPKRDSLAGYLEIVNISLVDLKESLVMFTNKSFREIIEVLTRLHKENPKVGLLDKLNFYSNQVLYLDKQIEFQLFGFNFMELITGLLMECETKNGNYVETTIEKVITNLEADIKMPKELTAQLRMVLEQNCNYLKEL